MVLFFPICDLIWYTSEYIYLPITIVPFYFLSEQMPVFEKFETNNW